MKVLSSLRPTVRCAASWSIISAVAAILWMGCATTGQVKSIVADSNAAMLAAQLPGLDLGSDPATAGKVLDPAAVSARIDEFIAAHPDQKVAASALRVRQAVLLIVSGKYDLARAAFADATELKTDRDKALKALSEPIIWWWEHSRETALNGPQRDKAREHLEAFDKELQKLQQSPDVRDMLAEMRARLGLKRVTSLQSSEGKREAFIDVLNHYGAVLTAEDIDALKSKRLEPQSTAISPAEKRRLRALAVIEKAKEPAKVLRDGGQAVAPADLDPAAQGFGELVLSP